MREGIHKDKAFEGKPTKKSLPAYAQVLRVGLQRMGASSSTVKLLYIPGFTNC